MKFIFWTNSYDAGARYVQDNISLQNVSKNYEFFFLNSGEKCKKIIKDCYQASTVDCENDVAIKGKVIFDLLKKRDDYDYLIRIDLDAIIFDLDKLLTIIKTNANNDHSVIGNVKKFNGRRKENRKYRGINYVRGACNAVSRSVIDKIDMITGESAGFDIPFAMSFHKIDCKMIPCKLFEINKKYSGKRPVWHPNQKGDAKFRIFTKAIQTYGKS